MECSGAQALLLDHQRNKLEGEEKTALEAHLESCGACRLAAAEERVLSELLERRLPRYAAPRALRKKIAERAGSARAGLRPWLAAAGFAAAGAALGATAVMIPYQGQRAELAESRARPLLEEAVNDHLRVLDREGPLPVLSSDPHTVKPWFQGRVDFAPVLGFDGNQDFPLEGGEVSYFLDKKAATFVFKRRLHVISLHVFRAEGLPWPEDRGAEMGQARAIERRVRGFSVLLWRLNGLGYALVSDVDRAELFKLGSIIASR